ncbi:MAG: threonine synthase, partial [Bacteroidota bacterium]|nr:threonine synthase [Bacteroidota bacterium]
MQYYSLKNKSIKSSFKQAVLAGIAEDKGLYFPNKIEKLNDKFYNDLINLSELEISFEVMKQFVGKEINSNKLIEILEDTISFDFPLIKLSKNIYTLELFHGPTMAFKD